MKNRHATEAADNASAKKSSTPADATQSPPTQGPYAGKPLDGSQYRDVIEEQEYADRRPSPEEQKPRFSYLNKKEPQGRRK